MDWLVKSGDILDEPADVLICSGNVFLNLSGGVGGAMLLRCGRGIQDELHATLAARGVQFVERGEVVRSAAWGLPVNAVLHAIAVNGLYETSVDVVRETLARALVAAASLGARRVAMAALATGYGRLKLSDFGRAVAAFRGSDFPPVETVVVCVRTDDDRDEVLASMIGT
jgi:O-acetyl-ADP-ribose deacetylase (regulator of RNase III)